MTDHRSRNSAVVRPLPPQLARAGAATLAASHADYPSFRHVFPDSARRARALRPFFTATVRDALRFGVVCAAVEGSQVFAVAVWLPPGAFPWSAWRKLRAMPYFLRVLAADPRHLSLARRPGQARSTSRHSVLAGADRRGPQPVSRPRPEARRGLGLDAREDREMLAGDEEGMSALSS
jgi:hypothetical protein